ncbi:MAG: TPM domain-containing protein [Verrucomicrobiaceae bacterium]|nr:TPM domain-containing protein [Verrucomicrobiaceae bacterium]
MKTLAFLASALMALTGANSLRAAEVIPPKPAGYFNDYVGVVSKEAAVRFNERLAQFERETSNQIAVAVFKKMESDSSIDDYTQRVAEAWGAGQKEQRNGAVLFVFIEDRKMFLQVGYGLEGVLPDLTAYDITERHIKPRFRANDYEGGLTTGIGGSFGGGGAGSSW